MAGIQLIVELDDKGTPKVKKIGDEVDGLGKKSKKVSNSWKKSWTTMGRSVTSVSKKIRGLATSLPAMLGAAGLAGSFGMLMKSGIGFNAQLESIETQFGVIFKDADKTKRVMAEIVKFSASTPFQLAEVAAAAKSLTAFGLEGTDSLRTVGDAAAAAQVPITELASTFGKISAGQTGEAFNRLAELGLATRPMLEGEGLVFDRGGSYKGSVQDAMDAVFRIVNDRFKGMMEQMSMTWNGAWSTMKDNWAMFTGEFSKPLFEKLKPRLKELTDIFSAWKDSGAIRMLGTMIANTVDKITGKILEWLKDLPRVAQWVVAIGMSFGVVWDGIKAGVEWFKGAWDAAINYAKIKLMGLGVSATMMNMAPLEGKLTAFFGGLDLTKGLADTAANDFASAIGSPGMMAAIRDGMARVRQFLASDLSLLAPNQEDSSQDSGWESENQRRSDAHQSLLDHMAELEAQHVELMKDMWRGYYEEMIDVGAAEYMDAFANTILNKHTDLQGNLENAWQQMKVNFVKSAFAMAAGWIASQVKMAITGALIKKAAAAEEIAASATSSSASALAAGAAAGAGAAKYHQAYAAIPFVGPALASTAIAAMNAQIVASRAMAMLPTFRTGGLVPGGGSGVEDDVYARYSGGEYVQPRSAVQQYGQQFMEEVRTGTYNPDAGGQVIQINLGDGANSDFERDVEEQLVPVVERLFRQRRLRFS